MAMIAVNVTKLNLADKLQRGQAIITKSTGNPSVPGNATVLAEFVTAQADLDAAINTEVATRAAVPPTMTARETALEAWMTKLNMLASFTETATEGDAEAIESAGFAVRAGRTPTQSLPAPTKLEAKTNGTPGHTLLNWEPLPGAKRPRRM